MNANVLKTSGSGYVRASPNKSNGNRSGWWDRPLVFLLMLLLAAVVCGMPLLVAGGYAVAVFTTMRGWLTEGTLGVHIVLWTLAAMVGFVVADRLVMIPHNPVGWPAWWILLTVAAPDDEQVGQILQQTYRCNLWRDHVVSNCCRVAYAFLGMAGSDVDAWMKVFWVPWPIGGVLCGVVGIIVPLVKEARQR